MANKIIYFIFCIYSLFSLRRRDLWVFGCYDGYLDNTKIFFEYSSNFKDKECIWLANSNSERDAVLKLGFKSVHKTSLAGLYLSSKAGISFTCTGFSDVNRFLALKSKVITFWHGTPVKKIFLDSEHDLNRFGSSYLMQKIAALLMRNLVKRYSHYYASSEFEKKLVGNAARLPNEKISSLGSPRFDVIRKPQSEILDKLRRRYKKIILYAPTWREKSIWPMSFSIDNINYEYMQKMLAEQNAILIIKCHPLTKSCELKNFGLIECERIVYSQTLNLNDINLLYPYVDLMITDVSSAIFDYLIFKKPVIIYMPDINEYLSGKRGVYPYFEGFLRGAAIKSWANLADQMVHVDKSDPLLDSISEQVFDKVNVCDAIHKDIIKRFM